MCALRAGPEKGQERPLPESMDPPGRAAHLKGGGFVSCQATELSDAILEGYPKSKKQFFVSGFPSRPRSPGRSVRGGGLIPLPPCPRRKSG